jgi:hypothetical protein
MYKHHPRTLDLTVDLARKTLVALGVVVLETDLEFDRLQEVAFLGLIAVFQKFYPALVVTVNTLIAVLQRKGAVRDRKTVDNPRH